MTWETHGYKSIIDAVKPDMFEEKSSYVSTPG